MRALYISGAGVVPNLLLRRAADNKWVSSAVSNALILRYLTTALSSECQNHANFFSLFLRHRNFIQNPSENFCFVSDGHAVGSTEAIRRHFLLLLFFARRAPNFSAVQNDSVGVSKMNALRRGVLLTPTASTCHKSRRVKINVCVIIQIVTRVKKPSQAILIQYRSEVRSIPTQRVA
jgi:hypothetical protein